MMDRVEIVRDDIARTYWWRLRARNGSILCVSETFASMWNARRAGRSMSHRLGVIVIEVRA